VFANAVKMMLAGVLVIVGLLLLGKGIESFSDTQDILADSTRIQGTVGDYKKQRSNLSGRPHKTTTIYYPMIEFVDLAGTSRRIKSQFGFDWRLYDYGETVEVLFNPRHPEKTKLYSFQDLWFTPIVLFIFGVFLLYLGGVLLLRAIGL
jgi:hypothetical protein